MTPMTTQQKVKNLSSNGMGAYAISRELGLTPSGVYYHFKVLGIPHRQLNYLKKDQTTHGASKRDSKGRRWPEYDAYTNAKCRCTNPKDRSYHNYGGRGIKFLYTSFEQFILDIGRRPDNAHSLERMDNEGNYEPGNCCWATLEEQMNNRRLGLTKRIENFSDEALSQECLRRGWIISLKK